MKYGDRNGTEISPGKGVTRVLEWTGAFSRCDTPEEVCRAALVTALETVGGGEGALFLEGEKYGEPVPAAVSTGYIHERAVRALLQRLLGNTGGGVHADGNPAVIPRPPGSSAFIALPFGTGRQVAGVLIIQKEYDRWPSDWSVPLLLTTLMDHAALAMENILLRRRLKRGKERTLRTGDNAHIDKVKRFFNRHYGRAIGRDETASLTGLSPDYLGKLFRESTGVTMAEYLNRVRVGRSAVMLKRTRRDVAEVARTVGFKSVRTFFRVFRRIMGVSPGRFRDGKNA